MTIKADHNKIKAEAKQDNGNIKKSVRVNKYRRYKSKSRAHPRQHVSARYNKSRWG